MLWKKTILTVITVFYVLLLSLQKKNYLNKYIDLKLNSFPFFHTTFCLPEAIKIQEGKYHFQMISRGRLIVTLSFIFVKILAETECEVLCQFLKSGVERKEMLVRGVNPTKLERGNFWLEPFLFYRSSCLNKYQMAACLRPLS